MVKVGLYLQKLDDIAAKSSLLDYPAWSGKFFCKKVEILTTNWKKHLKVDRSFSLICKKEVSEFNLDSILWKSSLHICR